MALYLGTNEVCPTKISNNTYGWLSPDTEYITKLYDWSGTMNNTTYSTWEPSTTSTTILNSESNAFSYILDMSMYDYYFVGGWDNKFTYSSGVTVQKATSHFVNSGIMAVYKQPNNFEQYLSGEFTKSTYTSVLSDNYQLYYNSSGLINGYYGSSYGPAVTSSTVSVSSSSTSGNLYTLNFYRPALNARCSSSYFDTTMAPYLDLTNSTLYYRVDVFRRPRQDVESLQEHNYHLLSDKLNNNYSF